MGRSETDNARERHSTDRSPEHHGHALSGKANSEQHIDSDAKNLKREAHELQRGNHNYSAKMLDEVTQLQKDGRLSSVADKLKSDGTARVMRDEKGEVTHLMFNADHGMGAVDVNVKDKMVNNETRDVAQFSANIQNMDYAGAAMNKPMPGEKQYSAAVVQKASDFAHSLVNNDMDGLNKQFKDIADDPKMQKEVQGALDRAFTKSPITFDSEKGTMQVANQPREGRAIVFPKDGEPRFADTDGWGRGNSNEKADEKLPANPDATVKDGFTRASQASSAILGDKIDEAENLATMKKVLNPEQPYPSMDKLRDAEIKIYKQDREKFFEDMKPSGG